MVGVRLVVTTWRTVDEPSDWDAPRPKKDPAKVSKEIDRPAAEMVGRPLAAGAGVTPSKPLEAR